MTTPAGHPPLALLAAAMPPRQKPSNYPEAFRPRVAGRVKRALGDAFGLRNFGVNLTTLAPGAQSALLHRHSLQDEFVFVLSGEITLVTDRGEAILSEGMCAGFPAAGLAHHLVNRSASEATYLEVGDRTPDDEGTYPADDLRAVRDAGGWVFTKKDGSPFD